MRARVRWARRMDALGGVSLLAKASSAIDIAPAWTKVWEFKDHFREQGVGKDWVSMPQYFKQARALAPSSPSTPRRALHSRAAWEIVI